MSFKSVSRMSVAGVLILASVIVCTRAAVLKSGEIRMQTPPEEDSANEINSPPVLCLRKLFGQDCSDNLTTERRDDSSEECQPDEVMVRGKCYHLFGDFVSPKSSEEKAVKVEEKLPIICNRGSELIGDKCEDKFATEDAAEKKRTVALECPPNSKIVGGLCTKTTSSESIESVEHGESEEITKIMEGFFKTLEGRTNADKTPIICLRGSVLIGDKCVDLFSLGNDKESKDKLNSKETTSRSSLSGDDKVETLPFICNRNSELIDGQCVDVFSSDQRMKCPLTYVQLGEKCISMDLDPDKIVFPMPNLCEKNTIWNGRKCVEIADLPRHLNRIRI